MIFGANTSLSPCLYGHPTRSTVLEWRSGDPGLDCADEAVRLNTVADDGAGTLTDHKVDRCLADSEQR